MPDTTRKKGRMKINFLNKFYFSYFLKNLFVVNFLLKVQDNPKVFQSNNKIFYIIDIGYIRNSEISFQIDSLFCIYFSYAVLFRLFLFQEYKVYVSQSE